MIYISLIEGETLYQNSLFVLYNIGLVYCIIKTKVSNSQNIMLKQKGCSIIKCSAFKGEINKKKMSNSPLTMIG